MRTLLLTLLAIALAIATAGAGPDMPATHPDILSYERTEP